MLDLLLVLEYALSVRNRFLDATSSEKGPFGLVIHRDLNTNSITSIAVGAFTGLANLTTLYVIQLDPELSFFSFYCHDRSLFSNRLTVIESGVFGGLSKLQILFVI